MRAILSSLLLLSAVASHAVADEPLVCGTNEHTLRRVAALGDSMRLRPQHRISTNAVPAIEKRNDIYLMPSDELTAPFARKFDLAQKSLHFTPSGASAFAVKTIALDNRPRGTNRIGDRTGASYRLANFSFPFAGQQVRDVYVSTDFAIHLGERVGYDSYQLAPFELASIPGGVISPLYRTTRQAPASVMEIWVDDTPAATTFTWSAKDGTQVQAALFPNGEIRFSYPTVPIGVGGVLISTGSESWRPQRTQLATVTDGAADLNGGSATIRPMLDIERLTASRVADLDMVEFRIDVRGAIDTSLLGDDDTLRYDINFEGAPPSLTIYAELEKNGRPFFLSNWAGGTTPAAYVDNKSLILRVDQDFIDTLPTPLRIRAQARSGTTNDFTSYVNVTKPVFQRRVGNDLSALDGEVLPTPIVESFTLPVLNVEGVWERLREQMPSVMLDETIDAVAIYQNFPTDIIFYAGAYSTGGNSGASGVRPNDTMYAATPRRPALLHMNEIGLRANGTERAASHTLLHELGHRWLLFISVMENGARSNILKPASAHPAQWVHTPAAFPVYTDADASVMGGGVFRPNGDGSFSTSAYGFYGYSWLDLYLMGLAGADEVPPFFYVANSNPALGPAYYAPPGRYTGNRRDVTLQQVIEATGPRVPAYPNTQKTFRMAMVLLTDHEPTQKELDQMQLYRTLGERDFRTATGGRGDLMTVLSTGGRRRSVRR